MDRLRASCCASAAALLMVLAGDALAQAGVRLDCRKATTSIERTVCGNASLSAADARMAAAYAALSGRLGGTAKDHLAADQARWAATRDRACTGEPAEVEDCLETRYREHTARLEWLAEGPYPFISEHAIVRTGKARGIPYVIDASYPQFDGVGADFSAVNREITTTTGEAAERVIPGLDADNGGGNYTGPAWGYEQAYTLHRPGPNAITVYFRYDSYEGGTQGIVGVTALLVDLRTGRAVGPDGVFLPNSNWLREITRIVSADVKATNLSDLLKQPRRYVFLEDRLELSFTQHEGGPYTVEIPYDRLRPLLRADGPVPR